MGLWPEVIFPPSGGPKPAPLPVLQSLAVAQVVFVLDDIHWMDPVTFEMFQKLFEILMQEFENNEINFILTAKSPEPGTQVGPAVPFIKQMAKESKINFYTSVNQNALEHRTLIEGLLERGAKVRGHDPAALANARRIFGDRIVLCEGDYDALKGADALVVMTDWLEYRNPNFQRMRELMKAPVVFDARNLYESDKMRELKFTYYPLGREAVT